MITMSVLVDLYNHMTTTKGKDIIDAGWKASGIFDTIKFGSEKMPSIDPFFEIYPMLGDRDRQVDDSHLLLICDVTAEEFELLCGSKIQRYICEDGKTDDESVILIGLKKISSISFSLYFKPKQDN